MDILLPYCNNAMFSLLFRFYQNSILSRFIVLSLDVLSSCLSLVIAITFRFGFNLDAAQNIIDFQALTLIILCYLLSFLLVGSHKGIIRHTSVEDIRKVFKQAISHYNQHNRDRHWRLSSLRRPLVLVALHIPAAGSTG